MTVLVIENYPNTTLGIVGDALDAAGADIRLVRTHAGEALPPAPAGYGGMVLLGGAQSAVDDADHPYLPAEAALARAFGDADLPVLGICLGAQLIARAYGAQNILGQPLEFGWHEVRPTDAGRADPVISALGRAAPVFHWHHDTFTLPDGAIRLAESESTANQAFRIGRATYAVQFHFEADTRLVASWTRDFADEIEGHSPDWFARHPGEAAQHGKAADRAGRALASAWVELLRPGASSQPGASATRAGQLSEGMG